MSLEIKELTFSYMNMPLCKRPAELENKVLDAFSATFESGKITALTGENGSGKSTLAKIIMGIIKPAGGHILLDGEDMESWSLAERGRAIGYVMQNPAKQIFNDTVLDEVMYGLLNQGMAGEDAEEVALGYIDKFSLSHQKDSFPFNLSHGEKQRLVLAAILAMKPKYLILDEPTASLDKKHRELLGELLLEIARPEEIRSADAGDKSAVADCPGCGIIVITHDRKFIEEYCDEEVCLNA